VNIIVRPRQAGKTYEAVQWVLEGEQTDSYPGWSRVLLCHTLQEADRIRKDFPALDYRQVFSWREWRERHPGLKPVEVAVDNADLILGQVLNQSPSLMTINRGDE
jgi:hypothetical protein